MNSLSLYELNNIVRLTIENTLIDTYWIRAEISELHVNRHCYLEFVQKDERGNGIIAKARGQVWASKWYMLKSYFEKVTRQSLTVGMQVLVKVEVTFHEYYGYSLNVVDIDPTYTLGDISRRRQEIIQTLKDEGVYDMNKELPLPRLLQRIAVISSPTAAGYGDFCNQLHTNLFGLAFHTQLFPAIMQGNEVEHSIITALERIAENYEAWDIVVIIRGGGSATDLSGFDTLELAENVAQFPIPIVTGIGHERDDTIIDMVAHTRVKTPTAAAEFIIHHQENELAEVEELETSIRNAASAILLSEKQRLALLTNKLPNLFVILRQKEQSRIERAFIRIQSAAIQRSITENALVENKAQKLETAVSNLLAAQQHKVEMLHTKVESSNPQRILNLGFSITRINGKAVTDSNAVKQGQTIETTLKNGIIKSTAQ